MTVDPLLFIQLSCLHKMNKNVRVRNSPIVYVVPTRLTNNLFISLSPFVSELKSEVELTDTF